MPGPLDRAVLGLAALVAATSAALSLLGVESPDAYASASILSYFVIVSLSPPLQRLPRRRVVDMVLAAAFALIVAHRLSSGGG